MYRIGDTVRVKNGSDTHAYHNWPVGTEAVVMRTRTLGAEDCLMLHTSEAVNGYQSQELYVSDVEFVSRSKYEVGDSVVIVANSEVIHYLNIGETATITKEPWINGNTRRVDVRTTWTQTVSVKDIVPYEFLIANLSANINSMLEITTEQPTAITTGDIAEAFETLRFAEAAPNDVEIKEEEVKCVRVQYFGDGPNGDDDSFTEFTSWTHPFVGGARSAEEGLVIDACTEITFLGKSDQGDLFSIRYEDTGNIVIAKGKLNNGYATYRA